MQRCSSWQPAGGLLTQLLLLQAATLAVLVPQHVCGPHMVTIQNSRGPTLLVWFLLPSAPIGIGATAVPPVQRQQQEQQWVTWALRGLTHPTAHAASRSSWPLQQWGLLQGASLGRTAVWARNRVLLGRVPAATVLSGAGQSVLGLWGLHQQQYQQYGHRQGQLREGTCHVC